MELELSEIITWEQEPENNGNLETEGDLPPEYCHYKDEGCELADSCLNCPFLQCIYDEPGGKQHWLKKARDKKIARLFRSEGMGVKELASIFGLSQRTIQRALSNSLKALRSQSHRGNGQCNSTKELQSAATTPLLPIHSYMVKNSAHKVDIK